MECRCRRRRPLDHHLIAGGPEDIEAIRALLALLPVTAYGQVFVAVGPGDIAAADLDDLSAPPRMSITRLNIPAMPGWGPAAVLATRDAVLANAIASWMAEWVPDEVCADRVVSMWIGGSGSCAVDAVCDEFPGMLQRL